MAAGTPKHTMELMYLWHITNSKDMCNDLVYGRDKVRLCEYV